MDPKTEYAAVSTTTVRQIRVTENAAARAGSPGSSHGYQNHERARLLRLKYYGAKLRDRMLEFGTRRRSAVEFEADVTLVQVSRY
jgi:hypothetical protein